MSAKIEVITQVIENHHIRETVQVTDRYEVQKSVNCSDGKHCQRLVTELETLLSEGWRVVVALPSGKVVVSNE